MLKRLIFIVFIFSYFSGHSTGDLFYKNYLRKDYGNAHQQNWQIVQDDRGIIYIANDNLILEFDGINWQHIKLGDDKKCRSLHKSQSSRIYVGGYDAIGYLATDAQGSSYIKLISKGLKNNDFGRIDDIKSMDSLIVFISERALIYCNENTNEVIKHIDLTQKASSLHTIENKIILITSSGKAYEIQNFELTPFNELNTNIVGDQIINIWQEQDSYITVNSKSGIVRYSKDFNAIDTLFKPSGILQIAFKLKNNNIAISEANSGLKILDNRYNEIYSFNTNNGLPDININSIFTDGLGEVWATTNNGISFISLSNPITQYGKEKGISTGIEKLTHFGDYILAASQKGILYQKLDDSQFEFYDKISYTAWNLNKINIKNKEHLFATMDDGLYEIFDDLSNQKLTSDYAWGVTYHPEYPGILWESTSNGIQLLENKNENWVKTDMIKGIETEVRFMAFENDSTLWCSNDYNTLIKYTFNKNNITNGKVVVCDSTMGKVNNMNYAPTLIGDSLLLYGDKGIFKPVNDKIEKISWFSDSIYSKIHRISSDNTGGLWIVHYQDEIGFKISHLENKSNKGFIVNDKDFVPLSKDPIHSILSLEKSTFFGGTELFERVNTKTPSSQDYFRVLFRKISLKNDSLIFNGGIPHSENGISSNLDLFEINDIPFSLNSIIIEVSSNFFNFSEAQTFSYYLEGYDQEWSKWSNKAHKEYTNIPSGSYSLKVKCKNKYGEVTKPSEFSFTILPPWWNTWWAYIFYALSLVWSFILFSNYRTRKLKEEQKRLEGIVEERTAEVREKNAKLEVAFDEIQVQKKEIESQHELLEEHHKEITDSINYAQGIQESVLPSFDKINEWFPKSFVLFKPKDVVSGDFFWAEKTENWRYLTAADCTGHGVPGAFVSMVGANGLNRSVNEYNLVEPSKILDKLTDLVEEAFSQRKDGMDISLMAINNDNTKLQWAGANNPLCIIRKESNSNLIVNGTEQEPNITIDGYNLFELKANKQPVGSFDYRKNFTNNIIDILPGDRCFAFSDGFPDQFGGPKGKKYMSKKMKKLLISYSNESISNLNNLLEKEFNFWIEGYEQIDDVCIVGVEI